MSQKLLAIVFLSISSITYSQQWEWVRQVNGAQNDYTSDIHVDDSGYVYITGRNKFAVTFEDNTNPITPSIYGHTDAFIAKYSNDGELLWAQLVGGSNPDWGWNVTVDHFGNVYYTGEFTTQGIFGDDTINSLGDRDIFITKLDKDGNFIWTETFGTTGIDKGLGIDVDGSGYVYVSGFINDTVTVGGTQIGTNGYSNGFIVKLDPNGNYIHVEDIGPDHAQGNQLKCDENGHIYLCGDLLYDVNIADYLVSGPATLGWRDGFLAKLDTSLSVEWVELVASSFLNNTESVVLNDNHVYITGFYTWDCDFSGTIQTFNGQGVTVGDINNSRDIYVAKYDLDGNFQWVKGFGGSGYDYGFDVSVSDDDFVYITGVFADTVNFDSFQLISSGGLDSYTAKLDQNGDVLWVKHKSGTNDVATYAVCVDAHQNVFVSGTYDDTSLDFDGITATNTGYDGFVGKLTQHTDPQMVISDTAFCEGDTVKLYPHAITSPITYSWDVTSQTGWVQNDTFCFIAAAGFTDINGTLVAANNIYSDTLTLNETIQILPGMDCGLSIVDASKTKIDWTFRGIDQILQVSSNEPLRAEMFSLSGGLVGSFWLPTGESITPLIKFSAGMYMIRLSTNDGYSENIKVFLK